MGTNIGYGKNNVLTRDQQKNTDYKGTQNKLLERTQQGRSRTTKEKKIQGKLIHM